jgi:hypothetical protein
MISFDIIVLMVPCGLALAPCESQVAGRSMGQFPRATLHDLIKSSASSFIDTGTRPKKKTFRSAEAFDLLFAVYGLIFPLRAGGTLWITGCRMVIGPVPSHQLFMINYNIT